MPSKAPPPVLHDWAGWSPYQQQTSAARVIESPIPAMLLGRGGDAEATGAPPSTAAATTPTSTIRIRIVNPLAPLGGRLGARCSKRQTRANARTDGATAACVVSCGSQSHRVADPRGHAVVDGRSRRRPLPRYREGLRLKR